MTKRELAAVGRKLLNYLPGFAVKGDLLIATPVSHTLRGILLDRSSDPRGFYAHVFFQPLFLPSEHVALNLGWRVGGGTWNADAPGVVERLGEALAREAVPLLSRIDTVDDMIAVATELRMSGDGYVREALAYGLARAGHRAQAVDALRRVAADMKPSIEWQRVAAERAELLAELLLENPPEAQVLLTRWETESVRRLNLAPYRVN